MFGHDDAQQQANDTVAPDGALGDQNTPQTDATQGAPVVVGGSASQDYIMNDTPQQPVGAVDDGIGNDVAGTTLPTPTAAPAVPPAQDNDALLSIKQQALQQLTPLVGHLDQSPEEKFRTTMMMIQASDNDALIKDAYAAAQSITDEKAKAQALLDIVNEINYFTQNQQ